MLDVWSFGGYHLEYKESVVGGEPLWESHCHVSFEAIAVLEGDITVGYEGKRVRVTAGQCALLSPLAYHTVDANHRGVYRRVTVLFDTAAIPAPLRERLAAAGKEIYLVPFSEAEALSAACLSSDREFFAPLAESILIRMLYDAVRIGGAAEVAQIDPPLAKILSYIDAHLCEPIFLDAIASAAMLSKSSLCHLFAERMKTSPKQYILKKKLALARARIGEGMMPTEAALSVGYEDYSSFYRAYKNHFGESPSEEKSENA
jgi:AraC-like DNA-binding protein